MQQKEHSLGFSANAQTVQQRLTACVLKQDDQKSFVLLGKLENPEERYKHSNEGEK